ncbi:ribonuclease P 40kDa subunit [Biscogniauxia marginata]|nr:ribonuclease P 40kDa subunit [Biscogniauxia marginata]
MFALSMPSVYQLSKCFVTYGTLAHTDSKQLPGRAKPWSTFLAQDFVHKVDLVLPEESLHLVREKVMGDLVQAPTYHRVIMTPGQVLEGDFFTQYIKIGNVMMLSEGKIDSDNVFSLKEGKTSYFAMTTKFSNCRWYIGVLTMYLDRETYERAGLVGKPHGIKGKRGLKPRWIIQFDLRGPSMLHGKKGFDRLTYACKNALNRPVTWLFCNLSKEPNPDPLQLHGPIKFTSPPSFVGGLAVTVPSLTPPLAILESGHRLDLDEYATDIYEWLSLVRLESPRLDTTDNIDPYLSTYAVPGGPETLHEGQLCKVSWQGFISPTWVRQTFADVIQALPSKSWFSLSATSFNRGMTSDSTDCTVLRLSNTPGEYFLWEIK